VLCLSRAARRSTQAEGLAGRGGHAQGGGVLRPQEDLGMQPGHVPVPTGQRPRRILWGIVSRSVLRRGRWILSRLRSSGGLGVAGKASRA